MKKEITGIVLAGGRSKRMGIEKGMAVLRGKPLITYSLDLLKNVCDEIIISANSDVYDSLGHPVLPDDISDSGPMGGIYTCLKASGNDCCIVLSCDMPLVSDEILRGMIDVSNNVDAVVPWYGRDHFEPLCAIYSTSLLPVFMDFVRSGNYRIPDLIRQVNVRLIEIKAGTAFDPMFFYNVNTRDELSFLNEYLS